MLNSHQDGAITLAKSRIANIGKLYTEMSVPKEFNKATDSKTIEQIEIEKASSEQRYIAIKNTCTEISLIGIDNEHRITLIKQSIINDIQSNKAEIHTDESGYTHLKYKENSTWAIQIQNLVYDSNNKQFIGGYKETISSKYKYDIYILKALDHSRTKERFYKIFADDTLNQHQSQIAIVQEQTLFNWERLRVARVLQPISILEQLEKLQEQHQNQDSLDELEIEELEDVQLELETGVQYQQGIEELKEILKVDSLSDIKNVKIEEINLETDTTQEDSITDYYRMLQRKYNITLETKQTIEEFLCHQLLSGGFNKNDLLGGKALNNQIMLRIVEENANKIAEQILDSGLYELQDFPNGLRAKSIQPIKTKAMEFCSGLYPNNIEVSLVDMLQIYRILIPQIFQQSKRYKNYINSCYHKQGLQCNFKKRDTFLKLVKINPFIQLDMAQKKEPQSFTDSKRVKKYQLEGKEYRLQIIALKAVSGFEAQFRSLQLGNKFQEDEQFRQMKVIK